MEYTIRAWNLAQAKSTISRSYPQTTIFAYKVIKQAAPNSKDPLGIYRFWLQQIKQPVTCKLHEFFSQNMLNKEGQVVESTTTRTTYIHGSTPQVIMKEKKLTLAGKIRDLFTHGRNIEIFNRHGDKIRTITQSGNLAIINPGEGQVLSVPLDTDIYYEPWLMDQGSYLFRAPQTAPLNLKGRLLKLGVEFDKVISR